MAIYTAGHITGSGNISSSGTITAEHLYSSDDLIVEDEGRMLRLLVNPDAAAAGDFRVKSANLNHVLYTDANKDKVGIGWNSPAGSALQSSLHIDGDLTLTHISASGNISASGDLYTTTINASQVTSTHITASGNISASGTIYASNIIATTINASQVTSSIVSSSVIYSSGSNIFGDATADTHTFTGHITASGNISASGYISASAIYADTIYTSGSTLYVGSEAFTQTHLSTLKQGKTIISDAKKLSVSATGDAEEITDSSNYIRPAIIFHPTDDESAIIHRTPGRWFFRSAGGDPFEIFANGEGSDYIRLGSTTTNATEVRIPGVISASKTNAAHTIGGTTTFKGNTVISGSVNISGSSTFTNWGHFRNRMHRDKHYFQVTTNPYVKGGWKHYHTANHLTGSKPHLHFALSGSGFAGVGLLDPSYTLHVSASDGQNEALAVQGNTLAEGFARHYGHGNTKTIDKKITVPTNTYALWFGPITISTGATVQIQGNAETKIKDLANV